MSKEPTIRERLTVSMGAALALGTVAVGQDVNVLQGALVIAFLVISLGIHEAAHAWVAYRCGDSTARDLGRITLNPLPHIDPFMTLILPLILFFSGAPIFGGAKPVPVNYFKLKNPLRDMMLVAIAGPGSNFLLAILFLLARKGASLAGYEKGQLMWDVLDLSMFFNILLAVFNLVPVPPLDGSRVMTWLLPESLRPSYVQLERFGLLIVIGLIYFVRPFQVLLFQALRGVEGFIDTLTGGAW